MTCPFLGPQPSCGLRLSCRLVHPVPIGAPTARWDSARLPYELLEAAGVQRSTECAVIGGGQDISVPLTSSGDQGLSPVALTHRRDVIKKANKGVRILGGPVPYFERTGRDTRYGVRRTVSPDGHTKKCADLHHIWISRPKLASQNSTYTAGVNTRESRHLGARELPIFHCLMNASGQIRRFCTCKGHNFRIQSDLQICKTRLIDRG